MSNLTEDERAFLNHLSMWGSDGYPIEKLRPGKWVWSKWRSINGSPVVYKTKRAAVEAFERYYDLLLDRLAGRI